MNTRIRKACEKDIPRIITLLEEIADVHNKLRPDIFKKGVKKYNEDDLVSLLEDKKTVIFIAAGENDFVLGYIFCIITERKNNALLQDNKTLFVDDLCIDKNIRGAGIGTQLFNFACNYAKKIGCYNITLNVWSGNKKAIKFYDNHGLKEQKMILEKIL